MNGIVIAMQSQAIALQFGSAMLFKPLVCVRKALIHSAFSKTGMISVLLLNCGNDRILADEEWSPFIGWISVKQQPQHHSN